MISVTPQLSAFLAVLRVSELTQALIDLTDDGYNVLVGATPHNPLTFPSYAQHPRVLNARLNSTAAGAYQLIWPTWSSLQKRLGLADFGRFSQDQAALALVAERDAIEDVENGEFTVAIGKCAFEWASLPGSTAGQHEQKMEDLKAIFLSHGGTCNE